jgi:hypothetical protein
VTILEYGRLAEVRRAFTVLLLLAATLGCGSRPRAPALRASPVYQNDSEGFRFLVPDGWIQTASTILPSGELTGESFLVRYRMRTPEQGATLQIECLQDSATLDPEKHHAGPSYRVEHWRAAEANQEIEINGVKAQRFVYIARIEGRPMTKEVVCFRRNGRVYSFVGLFWSNDDKAREQIRRAVRSTIWEE